MEHAWLAADGTILAIRAAMNVIAERALEFRASGETESQQIVVRLGKPEIEAKGQNWRIPYEIQGPDPEDVHRGVARGEDSMQALVLALQILPAELATFARRGELTWLGGKELGFSPVVPT